jgi:hypothetical protein
LEPSRWLPGQRSSPRAHRNPGRSGAFTCFRDHREPWCGTSFRRRRMLFTRVCALQGWAMAY